MFQDTTKTAPKRRVFSCHNSRFELSSILFCFFLCLCDLSGFLVDFLVFCRFRWFSKKAKVHWFFNQLFQMFLEGFTVISLWSCNLVIFCSLKDLWITTICCRQNHTCDLLDLLRSKRFYFCADLSWSQNSWKTNHKKSNLNFTVFTLWIFEDLFGTLISRPKNKFLEIFFVVGKNISFKKNWFFSFF